MKRDISEDLYQAYLNGKLPPAERAQFEEWLHEDPELEAEMALRRAETAAAELLIASESRQLFQQWQTEKPARYSVFKMGLLRQAVLVATALLFVVAASQLLRRTTAAPPSEGQPQPAPSVPGPPPQSAPALPPHIATALPPSNTHPHEPKRYSALAKQHLQDPSLNNLRRPAAGDSTVSFFQQAQQAYKTGNYPQTLELLEKTDTTRQQSSVFLSAHALFQLQRYREAEVQFERLIAQNSRQFRFQSEWGLLMCRLADFPHREQAFKTQLNGLLAHPEHPYWQQAKDLQKTLRK